MEETKEQYSCGDCIYYRGITNGVHNCIDCGLVDAAVMECVPCRNFLHREVAYQIIDEAKKKKE